MDCFANLAEFIIEDLDYPEGLSVGVIINWLGSSVGNMNTLLGTDYEIDEFGGPTPDMGIAELGFLAQMYKIKYYTQQNKQNLGASAYDWSELTEGDSRIRRVSKNEVAKSYLALSRDSQLILNDMVKYYRTNKAMPKSKSSYNTPFDMFYRWSDGYIYNS